MIEESTQLILDFKKLNTVVTQSSEPVVPVVVQHIETNNVLILAYVSQSSLEQTIASGIATFWSTSRNELWIKGSTSGDYLILKEIRVNCEQNSLLFLVLPKNEGVCHSKNSEGESRSSCFYRTVQQNSLIFLQP